MSFPDSQNSYGAGAGRYLLCEVINRNDPEQGGRLQVRVVGYQNDKALIPDEDCRWARIKHSPTNPMNNGVGGPAVGGMVGSYFYGFFADGGQGQQLILDGSMGKPGTDDGSGNLNTKNSDVAPHARTNDGGGDFRYDSSATSFTDKSTTVYARDDSPNAFQRTTSKDADPSAQNSFSLAQYKYEEV